MEARTSATLPSSIAVIDDDSEFADYLAQYLEARGVRTRTFRDGDDFLVGPGAFDFDFYIVDLSLPGVGGVDLVRLVRRKSQAGVVAVSGRFGPDAFDSALRAGADMYLMKPVRLEQVALAVEAIQRRIEGSRSQASAWRLDRPARQLAAPDGTRIELSDNDLALVECFVAADGRPVTRAELWRSLGRDPAAEDDNLLAATIYRLRRRIERATSSPAPIHAEQNVGYRFRAKLTAAG
jgi:DNA-binding response OmpR family regulator